jgi:transitional endoplasmic reticulum ATPase
MVRRRHRRTRSLGPSHVASGELVDERTRLWTLRALLAGGTARFNKRSLTRLDDDTLHAAGLLPGGDDGDDDPDPRELHERARRLAAELGRHALPRTGTLDRNVALMAEALRLGPIDADIVALAVRLKTHRGLEGAFEGIDLSCVRRVYQLVALTLGVDVEDVRHALGPKGSLSSLGLVHVAKDRTWGVHSPLDLMDDLEEILLAPHDDQDDLLLEFFQRAKPPTLGEESYPHATLDVDLMVRVLGGALEHAAAGVNVLLYGPPGTGKTELARLVGKTLNAPVFEVNVEDRDGDHIGGFRRCASYKLCQRILSRRGRALVLFDEIEDAFPAERRGPFGLYERSREVEKGWVNRLLESNPVPSVWISNAVGQLDPAMVRRFDVVVELATPPESVRRQVLQQHLGELPLSGAWHDRVAADERVAPAVVERLGRVARLGGTDGDLEARLSRTLERKVRLMDGRHRTPRSASPLHWDPRFVNADVHVDDLLRRLSDRPCGRVLLYGVPGTGKTALAREVARRADRPLLVRRASDLLSMWVGGSEKAIARMFAEARDTESVLLLDEADSFLRDRRAARASWEVTQVNELTLPHSGGST